MYNVLSSTQSQEQKSVVNSSELSSVKYVEKQKYTFFALNFLCKHLCKKFVQN